MSYQSTFEFQMSMSRLFMKLGQRGMKFDVDEQNRQFKVATKQLDIWNERANEIVEHDINMNSPEQIKKYLYGERKLEIQYKYDRVIGRKVTTDENALKILFEKYPDEPFLKHLMKHRKLAKLRNTYLKIKPDPDGRVRCSYGWNKTGRNNSSKNPYGSGANLQNQPRMPLTTEIPIGDGNFEQINIKKLFIADDGYLILEADGKQAESRIVAYDSGDENYINLFLTNQDIHSINATALVRFSQPGRIITKADKLERHMGKKASHGTPYGMSPQGINDGIIKELGVEYVLPEAQLIAFQKDYFKRFPGVKLWQKHIREMVQHGKPLVNPFGRMRKFLGKLDEKTYKEAYAQIPQSTVPDLINRGIMEWERIRKHSWYECYGYNRCPVIMQCHDSALLQIPEEFANDRFYDFIKHIFEIPMMVGGQEIVIPMEIQLGKSWGDKKEVA